MTNKNDGGNAFPYSALRPDGFTTMYADSEGMTLCDYFAAKVLAAMIANDKLVSRIENDTVNKGLTRGGCLASEAYLLADKMLAERAKWLNK